MTKTENEDLAEFLKPTYLVDSDNPKIIKKAEELTRNHETQAEKARALYEFVRDNTSKNTTKSWKASNILDNCGNNMSCHKATVLLVALCRAANIPARLHFQKVTIKNWKKPDGVRKDITFAHSVTGIYLDGEWHLYEAVGHPAKWVQWTEDEERSSEAPVRFYSDRDCLFRPNEKVEMENLPVHFKTITEEWLEMDETISDM